MSQFDSEIARRLAKLIEANIGAEAENVLGGTLTPEVYRDKTGYIRALQDMLESLKEIESDINQGK